MIKKYFEKSIRLLAYLLSCAGSFLITKGLFEFDKVIFFSGIISGGIALFILLKFSSEEGPKHIDI